MPREPVPPPPLASPLFCLLSTQFGALDEKACQPRKAAVRAEPRTAVTASLISSFPWEFRDVNSKMTGRINMPNALGIIGVFSVMILYLLFMG